MNKCTQCLGEIFDLPQYAEGEERQKVKQEVVDLQKTICDGCLRLFEGDILEDIDFNNFNNK